MPTASILASSTPILAELYQITALVYLIQASGRLIKGPEDLDLLLDRAFAIVRNFPIYHHIFPVIILACEARTDEQRITILAAIEKNEGLLRNFCMQNLKFRVLSMWVQQDLMADSDLTINYHSLLDVVIGSTYATSMLSPAPVDQESSRKRTIDNNLCKKSYTASTGVR